MKTSQKKVEEFCATNKLESPAEYRLLDLVAEIGEVAKEVLKSTEYGRREKGKLSDKISEELGDALYSLISVANIYQVDLETALEKALAKYRLRLKSGSPGSENS